MRTLLIFLAFVAAAAAQPSFDPNQFIDKKDLRQADVDQLWRTLGISGKIRETTVNGSKDHNENFECGLDDECEAQLFIPDWRLVDAAGNDRLVRIKSPRDMSRFLVFHQDEVGGAWRFLDYLDSTESHYAPARAIVVNSGGKGWLVVNSQPRCGTGCSLFPSDWFELKNGKLRMVLSMPRSGNEISQNPGRTFETRFTRASLSGGKETLEFVFHVEFSSGFGSSIQVNNLWDEEKLIRFSRTAGQAEFKFDAKNSEATEAFLDIFSTNEEVTRPRIFRLIRTHLLEIARGPNDPHRPWLKDLLEKYPNLRELAPVRTAFGKAH